tara:strand:+ start:1571 stop:5611 length:4041 start_codon:yes stop_codon:yes gene_type:complete
MNETLARPLQSTGVMIHSDETDAYQHTLVNSEDTTPGGVQDHRLGNVADETSSLYLTVPTQGGEAFRIPIGKIPVANDDVTQPTPTELTNNQCLEHLLAWRIQTPHGDLNDPATICRLPKWLREKIYTYRIWHHDDYADNKTPWQQGLSDIITQQVNEALLPTNTDLFDPGWLYIFRDGYLWRELQVITVSLMQANHYKDVDLMHYAGCDVRKANGVDNASLITALQTAGKQHDIQIAYSPVQWSWARITAMGGLDDNDERAWKNHERLSEFPDADKAKAATLRTKRMGKPLQLDTYVSGNPTPVALQATQPDDITVDQLMLREDNIPTLFVSNPMAFATRIQQDIQFLWQQLVNTVSSLPYQNAPTRVSDVQDAARYAYFNSDMARHPFAPETSFYNQYMKWRDQQATMQQAQQSKAPNVTMPPPPVDANGNPTANPNSRFHTALLAYQLCFNPQNSDAHYYIEIDDTYNVTNGRKSTTTQPKVMAGNPFYDVGKKSLNVDLLQQALAVKRRTFIRNEIRRLQQLLTYTLSQTTDGYVDTQESIRDYFAQPASDYGRGHLAIAGLLSHTTHDPRSVDHYLDIELVSYELIQHFDTLTSDNYDNPTALPGTSTSAGPAIRKNLPPQPVNVPPGTQLLQQLLQAKAGDALYPLYQALFPTADVLTKWQTENWTEQDSQAAEGTGDFNPKAWHDAFANVRDKAFRAHESASEFIDLGLQALIQEAMPAWMAVLNQARTNMTQATATLKTAQGDARKTAAAQAQQASQQWQQAQQTANQLRQPFINLASLTGDPQLNGLCTQQQDGTIPEGYVPLTEAVLDHVKKQQTQQQADTKPDENTQYVNVNADGTITNDNDVRQQQPSADQATTNDNTEQTTEIIKTAIEGTLLIKQDAATAIMKRFHQSLHGVLVGFALWDVTTQTYANLNQKNSLGNWLKWLADLHETTDQLTELFGTIIDENRVKTWMQTHNFDLHKIGKYDLSNYGTSGLEIIGVVTAFYGFATSVMDFIESFKNHDPAQEISDGLGALAAAGKLFKAMGEIKDTVPAKMAGDTPSETADQFAKAGRNASDDIIKMGAEDTTKDIVKKLSSRALVTLLGVGELIPGLDIIITIATLASAIIMLFRKTPLESWASNCYFNNGGAIYDGWKTNTANEYLALLSLLLTPVIHLEPIDKPATSMRVRTLIGGLDLLGNMNAVNYHEQAQWQWVGNIQMPGLIPVALPTDRVKSYTTYTVKNKLNHHILGYDHYYSVQDVETITQNQEAIKQAMGHDKNDYEQEFIARGQLLIADKSFPFDIDKPWDNDESANTKNSKWVEQTVDKADNVEKKQDNEWIYAVPYLGVSKQFGGFS